MKSASRGHLERRGVRSVELAALLIYILLAFWSRAKSVQLLLDSSPLLIQPADDLHSRFAFACKKLALVGLDNRNQHESLIEAHGGS
jgi:hypothetical protein